MENQNAFANKLIKLEETVHFAMLNHSIAEQLLQVLFKNYLHEDFSNDKEHYTLFGISHDDICALAYAINEFVQINTPIIGDIQSECEKLYKVVTHHE